MAKMRSVSGEETIALNLDKEEVRLLRQALNEVCNGLTFSDSEFKTRMGTDRSNAIDLMNVLAHVYDLYN